MNIVESLKPELPLRLLRTERDQDARSFACFMHRGHAAPGYRPCFSMDLLRDLRAFQRQIEATLLEPEAAQGPIGHLLLASDADVFNLGGDLELFLRLIEAGDREHLLDYARLCVAVAHGFDRLANGRVHSIAVVQGDALGGGFEAALCCHTIVAEEGTGMGFPEVLFDLFPGMGAFSYLSRRVSPAQAERMMLDGRVYDSAELHRMGVVDLLVPRGEGMNAARELVRKRRRIGNSLRSMNEVRAMCRPVHLDELMAVTTAWVDAALRLDAKALQTMARLVKAQKRRRGASPAQPLLAVV
jgi:DSF synthase